ncbi:AIR synthase-related protein [Desulfolutivibrio sulfoxidireducens]|uniref:AIR synthase-related protein n=1 Tax=Desulfolutivibrio sulfoxidireducens TaxID=2773299 RepID=UPI00159D66BA|nr:AIR synthase-related protein [Desulfolutivibrio sulfoxidireducens]QLA20844.1 phosphoribosylformylglycinamidine synthase [Desulfolutivibrio sulfoxidireducens]
MLFRVEVGPRPGVRDVMGEKTARKIRNELGLPVTGVDLVRVFILEGLLREEADRLLAAHALHDPVLHQASLSPLPVSEPAPDFLLEVSFRPGVTDNEGRTARETAALVLGLPPERAEQAAVYTAAQYRLRGVSDLETARRIGRDLLANELIQRFEIKSAAQWRAEPGFEPRAARVTGRACDEVAAIDLFAMDDAALTALSRDNVLALSLAEMRSIRDHYADPAVAHARKTAGLSPLPTDAEIEVLAQTWSEHCKHKIFGADIDYRDREKGLRTSVKSLYKTCIQGSTKDIRHELGEKDFCLSVFTDNAGVVRFTDSHHVCVKVETHNSPSALDPYGGALTGIVGVNRDPMGTGLGANLLCNTDVFCFASPFHEGELPPRLLHPRRVFEGVREGVEHGGNKSGIPTVNGSIVFDERYLGKPLVFCGTVGLLPTLVAGRPSHLKKARPGDAIVMTGGRIGKDGIHGATFSSEELHEGSPATAVQIGDPITQRKMYDFLMRARDMGLYNAITDNGAGGLSSSVGEMAQDSGGCDLDLSRAPLKYDGLRPWEILLSEAQERMTLAVPREHLAAFLDLAREMDVLATALGTFTDSGVFLVRHGEKTVARLDMDFLHHGAPTMSLGAAWDRPVVPRDAPPAVAAKEHGPLLRRMLGRLNICSKDYVVRQYDHEVKGASVVKPMVGVRRDGPSDAGVMRPILDRPEGLVISHGICPRYSDLDAYWMMANAIDEAVRNAVAVGADPDRLAGVDNFCWCDPVTSEKTPDGAYKLAQLVRANLALAHFCRAYRVPCVSGKDSMKNDYTGGGTKISIPPTVLFTVLGFMPDAGQAVTSDFKRPGDLVYLLGTTAPECGAGEIASELGFSSPDVPHVDALAAQVRYRTLFRAIRAGLVTACHDLSDGGLAVALAEMAIGGRLGAAIDLSAVPVAAIHAGPGAMSDLELLYSESAGRLLVCVAPQNRSAFEALFAGQAMGRLGTVTADFLTMAHHDGATLVREDVEELARAFAATLAW